MKHEQLTENIIGVFYEVYNELGHGFLESVYETAMSIALKAKGLNVDSQFAIPVWFRGHQIGSFAADVVVDGCIVVELKAVRSIDPSHEAQLLNYLRATEMEIGLLLNFGVKPEIKRRVFDNPRKTIRENPCSSVADFLAT